MFRELRIIVIIFIGLFIVTGLGYPLLTFLVAQKFFSESANGSFIKQDGKIIGSSLIGQAYAQDVGKKLFHGRPSATPALEGARGENTGYDASNSSASNLAPGNKVLEERVKASSEAWQADGGFMTTQIARPVPVDLVTTSASGLDPDISVAGAIFQVSRISETTQISSMTLQKLVMENTTPRTFGFLGEPRVNVLRLNLALERLMVQKP